MEQILTHAAAVLRGFYPYWLSEMRAWSIWDFIVWGTVLLVFARTLAWTFRGGR